MQAVCGVPLWRRWTVLRAMVVAWSLCGMASMANVTLAQGVTQPQAQQVADPLAGVYIRLDEQLALAVGRIAAARRPVAQPKSEPTEPANDLFVPRTREAYRRDQDQRFQKAIEANEEAQRKRREAFNADIVAQCGSQPQTGAQLGMAQARFEACGQEIRFGGGLTHIISLQAQGHTARLYVFALGNVHKVYAVDQRITRIEPHPLHVVEVTLPQVGAYPPSVSSPQMVTLSQGHLFGYGEAHGEDWSQPAGVQLQAWADKVKRISTSVPPPPFMWDASRQGWVPLPPPPACAGLWHMHTLTALPNDRVLVAGGLCDIPRLLNDMGTFEPQTRTALWDARQRLWLESPRLTQPRIHHTASLLGGQRVMLVGGFDDPLTTAGATAPEISKQNEPLSHVGEAFHALDSVELMDGERWRSLPPLRTARAKHAATVLPTGGVLVTGGVGHHQQAMAQVELWDEVQQQWLPRAPLHTARYGHTATLLADGRVLVTGGISAQEDVLNTTELYDPTTDTWTDGPPLPEHLQGHTALLLPDGRVLLAGGVVSPAPLAPWLHSWLPSELAWRAEGVRDQSMVGQRTHRPTLVQATPGQVLAFGAHAVYWHRLSSTAATVANPVEDVRPHFASAWWTPPPPVPAATVTNTTLPQALGQPGRLARLGQDLWAGRATLGWLGVVLAVLWAGAWARGRWRSSHRARAFADTVNLQDPDTTRRNGPGRGVRWGVRVLVYGALLVWAVPNLLAYLHLQSADMADGCQANASACLDPDTHLLARQWAVPARSKFSMPRIPCPFVGEWVTRRGNREFGIQLHGDGTYHLQSRVRGVPDDDGHWAVQGKFMLWRSTTHAVDEVDINRIVSNDGRHFELIETNGLHSHFDHQADLPHQRCEP